MKKITLWIFALFTCWQISAQTGTIVVGVDDGTPNTPGSYPSPMQDSYNTGRVQFLYTASELLGAGLVAGNITEIGWVVTSTNGSGLQEGYTISMKSTASTVLTSTFETGATVVYGPTNFTPSVTGNVMFTLSTPFVWDGTSNVIVEICAGLATGNYSNNVSCANSTTTGIKSVYFRSDSATTPCTTATGTTSTDRPLLVATGNITSCFAPSNILFGNITAASADISWDASTSNPSIGYEYVVSTSDVAPTGAGTATTNLNSSFSSLLPQTTYHFFVRSNCAAGEFSGWNGPFSFTTDCANVTSFVQNFDSVTAPAFPTCWARVGDGGDALIIDQFANSDPNVMLFVSFDTSSLAVVRTQQVSNLGAGTNRIKFDMKADNNDLGDVVEFGYLTNPLDASTFVSLTSFTISSTTYSTYQFSPPVGTYSDYPAFRLVSGFNNSVLIDNVIWEVIPTCPDQTGLQVSNITSSGANTSWDNLTGLNGVSGYEYAITTSATPPVSGTSTTNAFYNATGLASQTVYYLHVRTNCGVDNYGVWITIPFSTYCDPVTSFVQDFNAVTTLPYPSCWARVGEGGEMIVMDNNLYFVSYATVSMAVISTQPVSNLGAGTNRIKFDMGPFDNNLGDSVEFGYLTDPLDATTFVPLTSITISSTTYATYQYSPPAGSYSDYPAFRNAGEFGNTIMLDNIIWELNPACPDQTGLVVSNITSSGANTSWDPIAAGVEYAVTTSATPPTSGTPTTATFYTASGLLPQTVYYLHVRTNCGAGGYGIWVTIPFTTQCASITTLPWIENFDAVTNSALPQCWSEENGDWITSNATTYNSAHSGGNYLRDSYGATDEYMWTPAFDLVAGTSYDFSSWIQGDGDDTWTVDFYVNNAQNSTGATQLGSQYVVPGSGPIAMQPYAQVTRTFVPTTSGTYYFAFKVNEPTAEPWYVAFDDVELKLSLTNDNCANAIALTPGATFATNPLVATNVGATDSAETAPGCASYTGGDVWYSVVVPASGNITIATDTNSGTTITDTGLAVYSGTCGALSLVLCDDNTGTDNFSSVALTGRTPGEVLLVRAWEYGNDIFGTFQISAYDATLSSANFDKTNFVAYPNPVKNVLNLSYNSEISNVKVINLLGQEVLNSKTKGNDVKVNLSALTAGAYIVNITVGDTVHSIKVIKE